MNGKNAKVLRVSAATVDVVHPLYVKSGGYTGKRAWVRQVVEKESVCLPIAKVFIKGPFGTLSTEAALLENLPRR